MGYVCFPSLSRPSLILCHTYLGVRGGSLGPDVSFPPAECSVEDADGAGVLPLAS